jgi:hypothetical protein
MDKPVQRKRFKEGDEIEDDIILAEISERWALLEKGQEVQLVFLRDPRKRISQAPPPASQPIQSGQPSETEAPSEGSLPIEALKRNLPEPLQALDTFSKIFFATPLFE